MRMDQAPTRDRMTYLALRVLEDALAQAKDGPVVRTVAHRLALGWLAYSGLASPERCTAFWNTMADAFRSQHGMFSSYCRTSYMCSFLDRCWRDQGWPPPWPTDRANWAKKRGSETNRAPARAARSLGQPDHMI